MVDERTAGEKVMAFVTMIFAYMVIAGIIALVIAGTISTIGLIVLIVSLIRRHRAKVRGRKAEKIWFNCRVDFVFGADCGDCWFYHILVYLIQRQGCEKDENR